MDNGAPAMTLSVAMAPARSNWNRCWRVLNICCKSALASWHRQGMHRNRGESGTFTPSALSSCFQRRFDGGVFDVGEWGRPSGLPLCSSLVAGGVT